MIMEVCSVYDSVSGVYARPIFVVSKGAAVRLFYDEVNRDAADNALNKHPEDFSLWHLGSFDDTACRFMLLPAAVELCDALSGKI